jgi:hypothetical protein
MPSQTKLGPCRTHAGLREGAPGNRRDRASFQDDRMQNPLFSSVQYSWATESRMEMHLSKGPISGAEQHGGYGARTSPRFSQEKRFTISIPLFRSAPECCAESAAVGRHGVPRGPCRRGPLGRRPGAKPRNLLKAGSRDPAFNNYATRIFRGASRDSPHINKRCRP